MLRQQVSTATSVLQRSRLSIASSIPAGTPPPPPPSPPPLSTSSPPPAHPQLHSPPRAPSASASRSRSRSRSSMSTAESVRAAPPGPPTGNVSRGPPAYFPLSYKDAAYQWWSCVTPPMFERNVLALVPTLKEAADSLLNPDPTAVSYPTGTRVWRRSMVKLSGKNRELNEVCVERVGEEVDETLVMVHGYGAGLGFFYKNLEPLSRTPGLRLYALDMLGMGNSSRPPFKIHAKTKEEQVIEAENWFIDALEEWRMARKIERFTLVGHSLGGYLAVSYAVKYPGHLKKLILASPVGVPKDPYAVNASMPDPEESTIVNEFTLDQEATTEPNGTAPPAVQGRNGAVSSAPAANNMPKRPLPNWLVWLWDANVSPFSIVRMAGPLGPRFVSGWSSRRFNHLPPDEAQALHEYSFSIFKQKGSGEYALAYVLAPGAYARRPIIDRIQEVGRQVISNNESGAPVLKESGIPIVFMYGENDWMDVTGGRAAEEKLNEYKRNILINGTPEEKRLENGSARVVVIPRAGHHLYLDNSEDFNKVILHEMEKTRADEKRQQQRL